MVSTSIGKHLAASLVSTPHDLYLIKFSSGSRVRVWCKHIMSFSLYLQSQIILLEHEIATCYFNIAEFDGVHDRKSKCWGWNKPLGWSCFYTCTQTCHFRSFFTLFFNKKNSSWFLFFLVLVLFIVSSNPHHHPSHLMYKSFHISLNQDR